jgi:hypothetical protein
MSIQAMAWALDLCIPDPYAKLILISLANHADHLSGFCYPTMRTIAKEASCDRRTVLRKLPDLESAGHIRIIKRTKGKQRLAHDYQLLMPGCDPQSQPPARKLGGHPTKNNAPEVTRGRDSQVATKNRHSSVNFPLPLSPRPNGASLSSARQQSANRVPTEVIQNRIAERLGRGDIAVGWELFGKLSEATQDQLTAQQRVNRLDDIAVELARLSIRDTQA